MHNWCNIYCKIAEYMKSTFLGSFTCTKKHITPKLTPAISDIVVFLNYFFPSHFFLFSRMFDLKF